MLEVFQNLPKKYCIHYLSSSVFDRYSLDRQELPKESSQTTHSFRIFTLITFTGNVSQ